jgi:hypothetical protein
MTGDDRVRIPAVEVEDKILAGLTARQAAILAALGVVLWLAFLATRTLVPPAAFLGAAIPVAAVGVAVVLGKRDGLSLDRLLLAALRQARSPRRLVAAPESIPGPPEWLHPAVTAQAFPLPAPLQLPAESISGDGVVSLGTDGAAVLAAVSTVNFALRTPAEQDALVAAFGRWLNSLKVSAQILVRAHRIDLSAMVGSLQDAAAGLPHPALERAALEHASFLAGLAGSRDLLARQVLLVLREPAQPAHPSGRAGPSSRSAGGRLRRRIDDAAQALTAADLSVTVLDGAQAAAALAAATGQAPPGTRLSAPGQAITARPAAQSGGPSWHAG